MKNLKKALVFACVMSMLGSASLVSAAEVGGESEGAEVTTVAADVTEVIETTVEDVTTVAETTVEDVTTTAEETTTAEDVTTTGKTTTVAETTTSAPVTTVVTATSAPVTTTKTVTTTKAVTTSAKSTSAPKTGDSSKMLVGAFIALVSAGLALLVTRKPKCKCKCTKESAGVDESSENTEDFSDDYNFLYDDDEDGEDF